VLLLDEPLSALDAKVRVTLRDEIRRLQTELGTTTLFVTHDQEEALAMADRVGVMSKGKLEQLDTPQRLYAQPVSAFVADFVGLMNRVVGEVSDGQVTVLGQRLPTLEGSITSGRGLALIRPEQLRVRRDDQGSARVTAVSFQGAMSRARITTADGTELLAQLSGSAADGLAEGSPVNLSIDADRVLVAAPD
jgi:putative spermidine/putrescine transport system ATP-binding protein